MTTRYRLLSLAILVSLLVSLAVPVVALAQGPGAAPAHHRGGGPGRGGHHGGGPGDGGHRGGWGQNAMLDAFATALGMSPAALVEEIGNGTSLLDLTGFSRQELIDAVVAEMSEWMAACEQAGHLTQEQYRWMHEQLAEHVGWLVDNPQGLFHEWRHAGTFGQGWGGGHHGLIWAAADVLDMSPWDIRDAMYEGQTIAQLAGGVESTIAQIVEQFMAPHEAAANAAVEAGRLTQAQADEWLGHVREHAEWLIENTPPLGEFGHGYGRGGCH